MAWLEPHPTSGHFNICFRWEGRKLRRTLKTASEKDANAILRRFEENMVLLERGRLDLPVGADVATFLLSDGKLDGISAVSAAEPEIVRTLQEIVDGYLATLGNPQFDRRSIWPLAGNLPMDVLELRRTTLKCLQQKWIKLPA